MAPKDASVATVADAGLTPKARVQALRDLSEGRKLARAKQWTKAIEAYDRSLAASPDEPLVLSELGYAALQSNDLTRAESANKRALELAHDSKLHAQILYNTGRVAEARGDKEAARRAYTESVALRDNAEVKKHLEALGGSDGQAEGTPCRQSFDSVQELCACLKKNTPDHARSTCDDDTKLPLGDPRLRGITWHFSAESLYYLAVTEGSKLRVVASVGRMFEPGALGVHVLATMTGSEKRKVGDREVVVIRWEQHDSDADMAGLLLSSTVAKNETVCVIGTALGSSTCTPPITVAEDSRSGPADIEPSELDPEARAIFEDVKKENGPPVKSHMDGAWTIAKDGVVSAKVGTEERRYVLWK